MVVGLRKEIFAKTHTDTHKRTSAQRLTVTTMTHIHLRPSGATSCAARRSHSRSAQLCRFTPICLHTASSLLGRSFNPQMTRGETPFCFDFLLTIAKKTGFRMVKYMLRVTSFPGGTLPFCFSRSSSKVLAMRKPFFFASPCSLCPSFNPMSVTGRFALLVEVALQLTKTSSLIVTFAKKEAIVTVSLKYKASFFSSLSSFKGHVNRTDSVYWFLGI